MPIVAMAEAAPSSASMDDMIADLEKLASSLPSPPTPSPPASQGLSFSVAGIGLGSNDEEASTIPMGSWDSVARPQIDGQLLPSVPSELMDAALSLDFGSLGPSDVARPKPVDNGEGRDTRGRVLVHYVGGSVTFLLQIAVLAWGIRQLRRVLARRSQVRQAKGVTSARINSMPFRPVDLPLFSPLSPKALRKLVWLDHVAFLLIDVRHPEAARASLFPLENVVNIPETELRACLQLMENLWETRFPAAKQPARSDLLVFISTRGQRAQRAATVAAELGFNGCCVLSGGIQSFVSDTGGSHMSILGRDAVAFLLQEAGQCEKEHSVIRPHLIDVRRYDERALYGHIPGSLHIPAEEWPKALAMEASDWENNYHFTKLEMDDVVILYSRTSKRAIWVAQLCSDAGMSRCYVYKKGSFGWRLDPTVLPYAGYEQGDAPPEPVKFEVETYNREAAEMELRQKGLFVVI